MILDLIKSAFVKNTTEPVETSTSPFEIYRIKENWKSPFYSYIFEKDRIIVSWVSSKNGNSKTWVMATPTLPRHCVYNGSLALLMKNNKVEKISMDELVKSRNHWHKEFITEYNNLTKVS